MPGNEPPPDLAQRPRLLVCDDSQAVRRAIPALLGPTYEFLCVESAEEALERAVAFAPDLVISDLLMDGMDGYELCRRVRAEPALKGVRLILLTSKTDDDAKAQGLEVGADDYLFKPIRPRELLARVTSLLRLRRATLDLERRTSELERANKSLQEAQSALVQQEKLASLGQLVAGIAHELNNPINFCYGNTEFLQDYVTCLLQLVDRIEQMPELTERQRASLETAKREADLEFLRQDIGKLIASMRLGTSRAAQIVQGLRAFARMGSGQLEEVDLARTVETALTVLSYELRDRIVIHRDFAPLPRVRCESTKIDQVFVNLLLNASHAIADEGEITIRLREENGYARCEIRDTGCGMKPETRARIFDPFFTTKPVGKGTGLGLSITYGIVQDHGGRIEVDSEPGRGSTFTVYLPIQGASRDSAGAAA